MHRPLFLANHVQPKSKRALSPLIQMPVPTSPPLPQLLCGHPEFTPPHSSPSLHMSSAAAPAASPSQGEFLPPVLGANCQNLCSDKSFLYQAQCFPWIINHSLWVFGLIVSRALIIMTARKHLFPLKQSTVNNQYLLSFQGKNNQSFWNQTAIWFAGLICSSPKCVSACLKAPEVPRTMLYIWRAAPSL